MAKLIKLTNSGGFAIVDDEDYEALSAFVWHNHNGYAARYISRIGSQGRRAKALMHRQIMGVEDGDPRKVDHRNTRRLDNQRANLRFATSVQNGANMSVSASSTTGLKGASLCRKRNCFQSKIRINGRQRHLGYFASAEQAHEAYMSASREARGEFHNECPPPEHWIETLAGKRVCATIARLGRLIAKLRRQTLAITARTLRISISSAI